MASLIKSVKAFGEKATGQKINGNTLMGVMKDMGQKMTGKEIKGNSLLDIIDATTEDYTGGGAKVVTELPETGEEHTVYELQETKDADFPWLLTEFDANNAYHTMNIYQAVVVENEEDVTQEYLVMPNDFTMSDNDNHCLVFVKSTGNVYDCYMVEVETIGEESPYEFSKTQLELITDKTGNKYYKVGKILFIILTDFDYNVDNTGESPILNGIGHYLDGTVYDYHTGSRAVVPLVLTDATNKKIILDKSLIGVHDTTDEEIPPFVTQVNKIDLSLVVSEGICAFVPQPSRTIESYWIYTNSKWVNVDVIKPTLHKTVYGTLTDVDGSLTLACSIPYDEIVSTFENGDITILEYKPTDGDGYYYCAITDAQWGEADNPSLQLQTWSLLHGWLQYSPSLGFSFNNGTF